MSSEYASPARTETSLMLLCLELEIPRLRSEQKGCSPQIIRVVGRLVALSHQRYPRFSRRWQCAFAQPCQTAPYHQFQTKGSNRFLANMRDCFFHRIGSENQIEIGAVDHSLGCHFLKHF